MTLVVMSMVRSNVLLTLTKYKDIVKGLINAINDDQQPVKTYIHKSLLSIGDKETLLVLSKGLNFLNTVSRSQKNHRVLVMNVLREIINAKTTLKIPDDLAQVNFLLKKNNNGNFKGFSNNVYIGNCCREIDRF